MPPDVTIAAAETPATMPAADVILLPGRAAYLPATQTLLVADLHLGKAATFRRAGIPVPEGSAQRDLSRLERLVTDTAARRLVVLGDLFHAQSGCTPAVLDEFSASRSRIPGTEVILVVGNHDRSLGRIPSALGIDSCLRTLDEPPFHFVHEPATPLVEPDREAFTVAGHLHPTLALRSPSGDRIADRCFVAEGNLLVLPAFGSFTGGHRVEPVAGMRLWIARDDGVVDVTRFAELASRSVR
ncbi:MAG: ligase-associated DNA damage response endonuclease PdeM [Planctomycetota bacterium]|jgi:DNA ligase-associated metallophosphoesterase|nr:MAG: ligase-associated DNA damage response endonuclease PdeM [Planctomycetota bacterium]